MNTKSRELERIYRLRFERNQDYRQRVWRVLTAKFFKQFVNATDAVLDLGCGFGEFVNQIDCGKKVAMDLNPAARDHLGPDVQFLLQDCSTPWAVPVESLDVVFTSNFFEHLPTKEALSRTLAQAHRCLKPGGRVIAVGPNIKAVGDSYWDFWDHSLPLTEASLSEGLRNHGFSIQLCYARFLPYTLVNGPRYPLILLRFYLALPVLWKVLGAQFLIVAVKMNE